MLLFRIALLCMLGAGGAGCGGGEDGLDVSGSWTGTMSDAGSARTVSGSCTQSATTPTAPGARNSVRCLFTVTDPARGTTSQGVLNGTVVRNVGSPNYTLSFGLSVMSPPCGITVNGNAVVSAGTLES